MGEHGAMTRLLGLFRIITSLLVTRCSHASFLAPTNLKEQASQKVCRDHCGESLSVLRMEDDYGITLDRSDESSVRHSIEIPRRSCLTLLSGCFIMIGKAEKVWAEESNDYNNPMIPPGPEERSGLVVLRVAEVANFQEKILRAVAKGDLDYAISPQQIAFGTQILLRNSNLDGNMKLMIYNEVPRDKREEAIKNAVSVMNRLQTLLTEASEIQRPFEKDDLIHFADMYRDVRFQLNDMYEYLPQKEKAKYNGYFMAVTAYEKKIAEGTYNPDVDGILKLDYD